MERNFVWGSGGNVRFSGLGIRYGIIRRNVIIGSGLIDCYAPPYTGCGICHTTLVAVYHGIQFSVDNLPFRSQPGGTSGMETNRA